MLNDLASATRVLWRRLFASAGARPHREQSVRLTLEELDCRDLPSAATLAVATGIAQSAESFTAFVTAEYNQFLRRAPDTGGLQNWLGLLQRGTSPENVEASFVASAEYRAGRANDNMLWLTSLYNDLLGRDPDPGGLNNWLAVLAAGTSAEQVARAFSNGQERQSLVITENYVRLLRRSPEAGAVATWLGFLSSGNDRADLVSQIAASDEFFATRGGAPSSFIAGVYQAVLGRTPSNNEIAIWLRIYNQNAGSGSSIAGSFDIVVRVQGLTTSQQQVFERAAARWEQIIIGDVPNATYQGVAVDDLLIDAQAEAIDGPGGTLGESGPDAYRSGSRLPIHGMMTFDIADLSSLEANGQLYDVILHEMGHVLGIGTIWRSLGLLSGSGTSNPRFLGPQATAAYNELFGQNATSVPVEGRPAPAGSRDSHWRESVFGNELLTPYLNSSPNPISRVTVASLADLGYAVNLDAADPFTPA